MFDLGRYSMRLSLRDPRAHIIITGVAEAYDGPDVPEPRVDPFASRRVATRPSRAQALRWMGRYGC